MIEAEGIVPPIGALFVGVIEMLTLASSDVRRPSEAVNLKLSGP